MFILSAGQSSLLGGSYICILYTASDTCRNKNPCEVSKTIFVFESSQTPKQTLDFSLHSIKFVILWSIFDKCCQKILLA